MAAWIFIFCLIALFAIPRRCLGDEFSGSRMGSGWQYCNLGETYLLPVCDFDRQDAGIDRGVKLLRAASADDWQMDTRILGGSALTQSIYHLGLAVYADPDHWLLFGPEAGSRTAMYGVDGVRPVSSRPLMGTFTFLRVEKRGARYDFDASMDGVVWTRLADGFYDIDGAFAGARVGIMNRSLSYKASVFKVQEAHMPVHYVEYASFRLNGGSIPFLRAEEQGWTLVKSQGSCQLVVPAGAQGSRMPRILKAQRAGDWVLETYVTYTGAFDESTSHAGLALFADEDNWLIFGLRGGFSQDIFELGGMLAGKRTGPLVRFSAPQGTRRLRVIKCTYKGSAPRYYCYLAPEADGDFTYTCVGWFDDQDEVFSNKSYGVMGWESTGGLNAGFPVNFSFVSDYVPCCYVDYFNVETIDGPWTAVEEGQAHTAVVGGSLTQTLTAAENGFASAMLLRRPLKEDWIIDTDIDIPSAGKAHTGLALYAGSGSALYFGFRRGEVCLTGRAAGKDVLILCRPTEEACFLRIVKDRDDYGFYYSAAGQSWRLAARFTDERGGFEAASYGLMTRLEGPGRAQGAFGNFTESLRPTGIACVDSYEEVCVLTGENSANRTEANWGWGSGDLGTLFSLNKKFYMVFGDTFSRDMLQGAWIRNSIAAGKMEPFERGLRFDVMFSGTSGLALPRTREHESAMIPSGGIGIMQDGIEMLYIWIHEIYSWSVGGHRDVEGCAWAISKDGGATWALQNRLFDGNSNFQFVQPFRIGDTVYLYGNTGSGYGDVYLMRVDFRSLTDRSAYSFFAGPGGAGEPAWSPREADAVPVITYAQREIGIMYNEYLGRYLMTGWDSFNGLIVLQESPELWGPFSKPVPLFTRDHVRPDPHSDHNTQIYGSYSLPEFVENGGEFTYMTMTKYIPYQVYWMKVHFRKKCGDERGNEACAD